MSAEYKAVIRRFFEMFNGSDLGRADQILSSDYVWHGPGGRAVRGIEGWKDLVRTYRGAFPDLHMTIEDIVAEADKVVVRWTARGTHRGYLMGIAPTERQIAVTGILISRIANGKIAEDWAAFDELGMLQALGAAPAVAEAG